MNFVKSQHAGEHHFPFSTTTATTTNKNCVPQKLSAGKQKATVKHEKVLATYRTDIKSSPCTRALFPKAPAGTLAPSTRSQGSVSRAPCAMQPDKQCYIYVTRNSSIVRKFDFEASSRRIDPRHVELATVGCARDRFVDSASNSRIRTIERLAGECRRETRMITDQAALDPEMRHA